MSEKDHVTAATCKLITDATTAKIAAESTLTDAKIALLRTYVQGIKNAVYVVGLVLGVVLTTVQILLNVLHF